MWQWLGNIFNKSTADTDSASDTTANTHADPVVIMTCQGPVEAALYLSQLHDAGIPAASIGADSATTFGFQSGALADVRIVVPANFADAAYELLEITPEDDLNDEEA